MLLNGVLLGKSTNQALSKKDPSVYLQEIAELPGVRSKRKIRERVESHLVPFDALVVQGTLKSRYKRFISERAKRLNEKIREACALPQSG